jgi:hypothetical protein
MYPMPFTPTPIVARRVAGLARKCAHKQARREEVRTN